MKPTAQQRADLVALSQIAMIHPLGTKEKQRTDFALVELYGIVELVLEGYGDVCDMDSLYCA